MRMTLFLLMFLSTSQVLIAEDLWPSDEWTKAEPSEVGLDAQKLKIARDYALTGDGSGFITRHGKLVMQWGDPARRYDLKSTTKSIGVTALGLAIADGKLKLSDKAVDRHPAFAIPPESNRDTGWIERITIQHLATQTAGFEKPGGYTKLIFEPGSKWSYSDGGPNWLAECVTQAYQQDVDELMFERVFTPLRIDRSDLTWRQNSYREKKIDGITRREFGSGICANVDAMARIGYLYLRKGRWKDNQIFPAEFVKLAGNTFEEVVGIPEADPKNHGNASDHYGLLWWNNADGTLANVPRDAYWSWGLYDSLIVVIPSLDIVVARAGKSWKREWSGHYDVLKPFLEPIVASVEKQTSRKDEIRDPFSTPTALVTLRQDPDRPRSPVIKQIDWAPASTIVRRAKGGDNWPITWGDDDALYTAYGDGWGFEPFVKRKLSMGLCRITGGPENFEGANLRSETFEKTGQGARGPKASGILMVDGVLYVLIRNTGNSQLAWSEDRGETWTWSDWKFETSFGYPTFLNFGRNYAGARDDFVYVYSHDHDSAYERADQMVLARVPAKHLTKRDSFEFFESIENGVPVWTNEIDRRGAVFRSPGNCYRSSVSYSAPLKRYLWCQTGRGDDTRFQGGFAIYDAPEPWGPWTAAFETSNWDVGPGETMCLPTKWMSDDGLTIHLVFSGDDSFSVRKGMLSLAD